MAWCKVNVTWYADVHVLEDEQQLVRFCLKGRKENLEADAGALGKRVRSEHEASTTRGTEANARWFCRRRGEGFQKWVCTTM